MPRPRAYRDYDEGYDLIHGSASTGNEQRAPDEGRLVATLWVPNPEVRSGWNEWNVYAPAKKSCRRAIGYRR